MATRKNKKGQEARKRYIGGRYGQGNAYGNPDREYGIDARAYGHYRNEDGTNGYSDRQSYNRSFDAGLYRNDYRNDGLRNDDSRNDRSRGSYYSENDYRNVGYGGRNASDYSNRSYNDAYYYNPSDHDPGQSRSGGYNYRDYDDRDYDRNYRKSGYSGDTNHSSHSDYFDAPRGRDYYGSYPSYGQSSPDYDDRNRYNTNDYEQRNESYYGSDNRPGNYERNDPRNSIGREPIYGRRNDDRDEHRRHRPNIRDSRY